MSSGDQFKFNQIVRIDCQMITERLSVDSLNCWLITPWDETQLSMRRAIKMFLTLVRVRSTTQDIPNKEILNAQYLRTLFL